jgi:hypothetical protein
MPLPPDTTYRLPSREEAEAMLDRLSTATEASPRLDDAIHDLLEVSTPAAGEYTSSLDAILDLIEIVLPDWSVEMQGNRDDDPRYPHPGRSPHLFVSTSWPLYKGKYNPAIVPAVGATRALSACCALFASLASEFADRAGPRTADAEVV